MIPIHEAMSLRQEAEAIKEEWEQGVEPDAQAALLRRPELRADKSIVVDLAYEEYCLRFEAGARPDVDAFCDRFPTFRRSVRRLVAGHQLLAENIERLEAQPPVHWPEVGDRLGDLTLLRELGRGAFARVYLAAEESTGDRPVVVKLSPEGDAEARTMGRLHHPHIVPILSARFEGSVGLTAVCMPFLGAATLTDVLDRAFPTPDAKPPCRAEVIYEAARSAIRAGDPVPQAPAVPGKRTYDLYTDAAAGLALQIAEALALLHKEGVCHRDLKPSNVLITPEGQALLLDFNLSADVRAALPRLGGTLPYMAPEQLRALVQGAGEDGPDGRGDLFALGVILYELLCGQHPFGTPPCGQPTAAAAATLLERQQKGFTSLSLLNPAVDRRLARLVESCLSFDTAGRPTSATSLAAAFRRYLSLPSRVWRGAVRRPLVPAAAAGLLLLAAGGAAGGLASQQSADARDYQLGQVAYLDGDYVRAEEQFRNAFRDFPGDATPPRRYYLAHAATLIRLGEQSDDHNQFGMANQELIVADKQQSDGATKARIGYCSSRLNQHDVAVEWYNKAIQEGFVSAALYNDRGMSYLKQGKFDEAGKDFDTALSQDPALLPALHNRALSVLQNRSSPAKPLPILESTLDGMQRVADSSPPARQIYLDAAQLCALAVQDGGCANPASRTSQALFYLRKAIECGQPPKRLDRDPVFHKVFGADPRFQDLLNTSPGPSLDPAATQWVDPASNSLE